MKDKNEPITGDEFVIRLVWTKFFDAEQSPPVLPRTFVPRSNERDGVSVFRLACVLQPEDVLRVLAIEKRPLYGIVLLKVADLNLLGMSVVPSPIEGIAGHAVIPELNVTAFVANRNYWKAVAKDLARLAAGNIVRAPELD